MRRHNGLYLPSVVSTGGGGGGGGGGGVVTPPPGVFTDLPKYTLKFAETFDTPVAEGAMFAPVSSYAKGLGAYTKWGAQTYLTTYGKNIGTGDYYGINNMSVVSGIAGATGNCLQMRLYIDSSGKKVGANPYPIIQGGPGSSSASNALKYGRFEARYKTTSTSGWKTAWLFWPQTWKWTNELDFPESSLNGQMGGNVHKPDPVGANASTNAMSWGGGPVTTNWNTVALEWTPAGVAFIVNGVTVKSTTTSPAELMFHMLQTENNLPNGGPQPTGTAFLWVDSYALWQWHA